MEEREKIARLQEMVDQSHSIVFLAEQESVRRAVSRIFAAPMDCTISNMLILRKLF